MKLKQLNPKKSRAQAMVEFAIALPVLLALLYGILETGRLIFLYSTVVNASRQAVRYGSATGTGNGTGNTKEPRYQDCDGIRAVAQKGGYMGAFDTITLAYDSGPSTSSTTYCSTGALTDNTFKPSNGSRVSVTVSEPFKPLVPKLVPFIARTITATSSRSIIVSVTIKPIATATFTPTITPSPTNTPTASNTPTKTNTPLVSNTPSKTPTITLTPTKTLTPTITLSPTNASSPVPSCTGITHGPITTTGNTMTMTITNPWGFPLTTGAGSVTWNDDKGHQTGSDKTLKLQSINIGGTTVWTGSSSSVSTMPWTNPAVIPANTTVTITFTFHQSYDNVDGTESIYINLSTPGCTGNPIQS